MTYKDEIKEKLMAYFKSWDGTKNTNELCEEICEILSEKSYEDGLNDAWDCARKVIIDKCEGGISYDERTKIFGSTFVTDVMKKYTASEAIAKIKEYEVKQKQGNELNIGDEIIITLPNALYKGEKGIVTQADTQIDGYARIMFSDGYENSYKIKAIKKTGKSYPEFVNILEQLKEDKE